MCSAAWCLSVLIKGGGRARASAPARGRGVLLRLCKHPSSCHRNEPDQVTGWARAQGGNSGGWRSSFEGWARAAMLRREAPSRAGSQQREHEQKKPSTPARAHAKNTHTVTWSTGAAAGWHSKHHRGCAWERHGRGPPEPQHPNAPHTHALAHRPQASGRAGARCVRVDGPSRHVSELRSSQHDFHSTRNSSGRQAAELCRSLHQGVVRRSKCRFFIVASTHQHAC